MFGGFGGFGGWVVAVAIFLILPMMVISFPPPALMAAVVAAVVAAAPVARPGAVAASSLVAPLPTHPKDQVSIVHTPSYSGWR